MDCYLLNIPEILLSSSSKETVFSKILSAFEFLESEADKGRIKYYGMSCWNLGRQMSFSKYNLDINELVEFVKNKFGKEHRFRFIQAPLSLGMSEGFSQKYGLCPTTGG